MLSKEALLDQTKDSKEELTKKLNTLKKEAQQSLLSQQSTQKEIYQLQKEGEVDSKKPTDLKHKKLAEVQTINRQLRQKIKQAYGVNRELTDQLHLFNNQFKQTNLQLDKLDHQLQRKALEITALST